MVDDGFVQKYRGPVIRPEHIVANFKPFSSAIRHEARSAFNLPNAYHSCSIHVNCNILITVY